MTPREQLIAAEEARSLLIRAHNKMGAKYRAGNLTLRQWGDYLAGEFNAASLNISERILAVRSQVPDCAAVKARHRNAEQLGGSKEVLVTEFD